MKFPELEIENFLAITSAKLSLADRGLVLIQGDNQADTSANSNGAGKSSIPDALCWCWFGTTARGQSGNDIINEDAGKNCMVRSVVVDGHMTYTATRHRKHKTGKNSLTIKAFDGMKETDLTKGTDKLTQEVANAIIGCSLEVFSGSIYAGQDKMPDLPGMTDKQLKLLIEEAAGVTVLEAAYKKARETHHEKQIACESATNEIEKTNTQIDFLENQLSTSETHKEAWEKQRADNIAHTTSQIRTLVPELKKLQADIATLDPAGIKKKIEDCDASISSVSDEQKELTRLENLVSKERTDLAVLERDLSTKTSAEGSAQTKLAKVSHQVGCPCSACGRPLTEAEIGTTKRNAEEELKRCTEAKDTAEHAVTAQKETVRVTIDARDKFASSMTDISAVSKRRTELEAELTSCNALVSQQQVKTSNAKSLRDRLTQLQSEDNPHHETITMIRSKIETAKEKRKSQKEIVDKRSQEVALDAEVVKIFGPAGVRAHILDEVTPFLNAQTAKYLTTLSDGNIEATWNTLTPDSKGNLKEKFTIDVSNSTGGKSFKALSGGEKRKVRLATALALQDLVATRASKPIELFIGDEIDDALDVSGMERLMMVLEEKARERGSVFVISHNELRDYIKQILLVEKLPNKTTKVTEMTA